MSKSTVVFDKTKQLLLIYGYIRAYLKHYFMSNIVDIIKEFYVLKFYWDKTHLVNGLILNENDLIVTHTTTDANCNLPIMCNIIFESGIHFYEIEIVNQVAEYDLFIGVVYDEYIPKRARYIGKGNNEWGF